jgi:regulatory protein
MESNKQKIDNALVLREGSPEKKTYQKALKLVAGREYSSKILRQKLLEFEFDVESIELVLQHFIEKNWVNDQRYAEMYVRKKWRAGLGPVRISRELQHNGVGQHAKAALDQEEIDWFEAAKQVFIKKYKNYTQNDLKALAKQTRFLQYRGFSFEHIQYVLKQNAY